MKRKIIKIAILFLVVGLVSCGKKGSASDTEDETQSENRNRYTEEYQDNENEGVTRYYQDEGTVRYYEDETKHVDAYHKALEEGYAKIVYKANDNYYVGICDDNRYVIFRSTDWLSEGDVLAGDVTSSFADIYDEDNDEISFDRKGIKYNFDDCIKYLAEEDKLDSRGINKYKQILVAENQYGEIVYEGRSDYCIVSTRRGYSIVDFRTEYVNKGDIVYGNLNKFSSTYVYVGNNTSKSSIYIEEYAISKDRAIEWMGEHDRLKYDDQKAWDNRDNDW